MYIYIYLRQVLSLHDIEPPKHNNNKKMKKKCLTVLPNAVKITQLIVWNRDLQTFN